MELGAGAIAVVSFFAHLTLYHLSFHCPAVYKHTQNLGSVNANWSLVLVPLILVMMSEMV